ncbi:putative ribonuclease H-like domain-containing protein [Tanacetum coccineum]
MDLDAVISLVPLHVADKGRFDDTHVSDQPKEQLGVFSAAKVLTDVASIRRGVENIHTYTRRRTISIGNGGVSTASGLVSTVGMAQEVEINIPSPVATKDKGKVVMQESEQPKKIKKRVQIQMSIDEELAQKLHEEEQARFNVEQEAKKQSENYSEEDLPRKLVELFNQSKKLFAQQRPEAKRNKPMNPTQHKAYMSTYIKNQEGETKRQKIGEASGLVQEQSDERQKIGEASGLEEHAKRQKIGEASGLVQEQSDEEPKTDELSQEQLQQLMIIVPEEGMNVETPQTKYLIIDWEVYSKDTIKDDLVKLWSLVYERFNSTELTHDKAKQLWVELKRLFEPDENDTLWKIQRYMHDLLTWKLYDTCGVHHVSTERGLDIFMLVMKDYPLTRALMIWMMCNKLRVDEYSEMANELLRKIFILIENLVDKKVKIIRCDNGTEFKNRVISEFCEKKGIKREFSIARTPQQNGVAERRNRTLIEAARTMLADSMLPTTFWAEAVNTTCYVQNRVLVVKPHNKTLYELFRGRTPYLSFMKPFGCDVTILNTLDHLGKFDGKSDDGFFVRYSLNSKTFRVYNIRTRKVEENLHVRFLEDKPIIAGDGPKWLFDINVLTKSMNYVPVVVGTTSNDFVGTKESIGVGHSSKEPGSSQDYILMPLWKDGGIDDQERTKNSAQDVNTVGPSINTTSTNFNTVYKWLEENVVAQLLIDEEIIESVIGINKDDIDEEDDESSTMEPPSRNEAIKEAITLNNFLLSYEKTTPEVLTMLRKIRDEIQGEIDFNKKQKTIDTLSPNLTAPLEPTYADIFGDESELDLSNIATTYPVPTTPNTRIHKDHSLDHVLGDVQSGVQTRRMINEQRVY